MMMPRVRGVMAEDQRLGAQLEPIVGVRPHDDRRRFGELDLLGERRPPRHVGDDLVTRAEQAP